ncbi:hypothetical protein DMB66_56320 [Actinoplanes sp. ATCC 53533]|nr:hypothetical protein DMB66_56320 [Actinoplanes sp. ATCC 53533]
MGVAGAHSFLLHAPIIPLLGVAWQRRASGAASQCVSAELGSHLDVQAFARVAWQCVFRVAWQRVDGLGCVA